MAKYAKDQPSGFENKIERIAIVGAGGTIGHPITTALLSSTSNHTLTALTRKGSSNTLPSTIRTVEVDYTFPSTITTALQTHSIQRLIITLSPTAPKNTHSTLVRAAAAAGVKYIMKKGDMSGFGKLLYARSFFPEDPSDFSEKSMNELLGLPGEDLDEATGRGVEMVDALSKRVERMAS